MQMPVEDLQQLFPQQIIDSTGTILEGGADQVFLPIKWDLDWITEIHLVESE